MSEETKKFWDLVKVKINSDGLKDIALHYPELAEEIREIIAYRKKVNNFDEQ
jgi:hypothetical protein